LVDGVKNLPPKGAEIFRFRLVPYHELLGGVGKAKDSGEADEVDKDADEEVSTKM
jgi:hypothetical protein